MIFINLGCEDDLSDYIMTKIIEFFSDKFELNNTYSRGGYGYLKANLKGFNQAAQVSPFFILTDLDQYTCPPELLNEWMKFVKHPNLIFRIAEHEVESWLLADREGFSNFTGVHIQNIPVNPDMISDPKRRLFDIVRRSRKRSLREDIIPRNEFAKIGPNYNERLFEYITDFWDIDKAKRRSRSLQKTIDCLDRFQLQ